MQWFLTRMITIPTNSTYVTSRKENFATENLSVNFGGLDGVGFMKTVVNFFETQRLIKGNAETDVLRGLYLLSNPFDLKAKKNLSYMNFVWQGDELLIDNSETFNQFDEHAHLCHQRR